MSKETPIIKDHQPLWQPQSIRRVLMEMIDDCLTNAKEMLGAAQAGVNKPYVFDDHSILSQGSIIS